VNDAVRLAHRVLQAQAGDRGALDDLFRHLQVPLYGYLARLTGDRADAEDLLQDVFILVHRKLRWLRDPALFDAWAYRIASRLALKRLASERRGRKLEVFEPTADEIAAAPAPEAFMPELRPRLPELVGRLSPASRMVIVLHYLQERPLSEVADILGISDGTTKSRLAYGLATLRRLLKEP
jgi:RNA polymerase sigma-70 factor (ECF subfamily)